jgi:hypothetical protein
MNFPLEKYSAHVNNRFRSHWRFSIHFPAETIIHITGIVIHFLRNFYSHRAEYATLNQFGMKQVILRWKRWLSDAA